MLDREKKLSHYYSFAVYHTLTQRTKEVNMFAELMENVMHSTPQGFLGVSLIFIYFAIMLAAIVYRIKKGEHVHH